MQDLKPFAAFTQNFCADSFNILNTYQEAVYLSLQVCLFKQEESWSLRVLDSFCKEQVKTLRNLSPQHRHVLTMLF